MERGAGRTPRRAAVSCRVAVLVSSGPRAAAKRLSSGMSTSTNKDVEEKKLDAIVGKDHSSSSILAVYVQGILFSTYYARTRAHQPGLGLTIIILLCIIAL